jgi:hypothetical protein
MARDIDTIIDRVSRTHPRISVQQLRVAHSGDDAGIWFFKVPGQPNEVHLESSTGMCPFLIESTETDSRATAASVEEAISSLEQLLCL